MVKIQGHLLTFHYIEFDVSLERYQEYDCILYPPFGNTFGTAAVKIS